MKIYTGKGDKGKTSILGPTKLYKDDIRVRAYGTVDELNSVIGITIDYVGQKIRDPLMQIQNDLFSVGSDLASIEPLNFISTQDVQKLENIIDQFSDGLPELKSFILPGGSKGSAWLHFARTVARRAEREIVSLSKESKINMTIIPWTNRLSDLFFVLARYNNLQTNVEDIKWEMNK